MKLKYLIAFALFGLATLSAIAAPKAESKTPAEPTQDQKIYYVEHRLLPDWTFKSEGRFFADVSEGKTEKLKSVFSEILGPDADKIAVEVLKEKTEIVITFPEPRQMPQCYFVMIVKAVDGFRYLALEKTEDIMGKGVKACFCEWGNDGSHINHGPTMSAEKGDFLKMCDSVLNSPKHSPGTKSGGATKSEPDQH